MEDLMEVLTEILIFMIFIAIFIGLPVAILTSPPKSTNTKSTNANEGSTDNKDEGVENAGLGAELIHSDQNDTVSNEADNTDYYGYF